MLQPSARDTIAALATADGPAAIAVIRLSGPLVPTLLRRLAPERTNPFLSHRLHRVVLKDPAGALLDDALAVLMSAPNSYTGEAMGELHVHGAPAVVQGVLRACFAGGARQATPGEFTLRAFLHGKMDLSQAEAVAELLAAGGARERAAATRQLRGGLSQAVGAAVQRLEAVLGDWRAAMDFPDYDTGEGLQPAHVQTLRAVHAQVDRLLQGRALRRGGGARVALCGAPNAGKSTLLNAWAGEERVLVDATPGTTRDPVEVPLEVGSSRLLVCDTAGLRDTTDGLERRGIALSRTWVERADLVVWLVAGDAPQWPEAGLPVTACLGSKQDLCDAATQAAVVQAAAERQLPFIGWVAARDGHGIAEALAEVASQLQGTVATRAAGEGAQEAPLLVNQRHEEALGHAKALLAAVLSGLDAQAPLDILALDLEQACRALGAILGRDIDGAVLDRIFARFCIGK